MLKSIRSKNKTDEEILQEYQSRDQAAVEDTARRYEKQIFRTCFRLLRDRQTAQECANDVLMKAWSTIPPQSPDNLGVYLSQLARQISIDRIRRETRRKRSGVAGSLDDYREILEDRDTVDLVEAKALTDALERFLYRLSPRERACFIKRFYYACSLTEIAADTGISRSAVHRMLNRIRDDLKEFLTKEGFVS